MRRMTTPNETIQVPAPLQIALVTETYLPEVNGVAITLGRMVQGLRQRGHAIHLVRPRQHKSDIAAAEPTYRETLVSGMPIPGYPELKSGLPAKGLLLRLWKQQRPDIVHIATEGPLGWSALSAARKLNIPVSTDFHTNFHSYTQHYGIGLLKKPIAAYLRHFHNKAACTLVPTVSLQQQLEHDGYRNVLVVSRGVDSELFHPAKRSDELRASWGAKDYTPVVMLVSRVAPEKNLHLVMQAFERMREVNPLSAAGDRGRWPGTRRIAEAASARDLRRDADWRGARTALRQRRYLPLPQPDRDLRQCHRRGDGQRSGDRRLRLCRRTSAHRPRHQRGAGSVRR